MKKIIYIICVLIAAMFSHNSAKASMLVNNLEEDVALYSAASDGLKGNVYTIATYKVYFKKEFGQRIPTTIELLDSVVYDENHNRAELYRGEEVVKYKVRPDSIIRIQWMVSSYDDEHYNESSDTTLRYYNDAGRLVRIGNKYRQAIYEYTPSGYIGTSYPNPNDEPYILERNNNVLKYKDCGGINSGCMHYNATGKVTYAWHDFKSNNYAYIHDKQGNITKITHNYTGKTYNVTNYEYLYDEHGNWIGRNEYKTIDGYFKKKSDGEHGDGQWSMIRHISYKSPAEIKKINEERRAAETAYNDSLINAAKQYSYEFVTSKHTEYINRLSAKGLIENKLPRRTSGFPSFSDAIKPIKSFKCEDGRYSFSFNDGFEVDSVTFTIECGNEIYSDNAKYCLKWTSLEDGIVWIIARYKNGCSLDYTFDEAYDWKDVAQRYFAPSKDKKDEWNTALSYILEDYWNQKNIELECVNYIPEAYENGFKAPPAYSDGYKVEQTYFAQKNEKISKALCHAAFNACVFNNKSKPNAPKLKKFSCTDNKYTFVMNDKSEITDVTFDTELSGRDVMVTLSNDKKIALVIKRIYADYYIFVVKFENGDIKSINYISPKDARHFQHPQGKDLLHRYSTGYT